MGGATIVSLLLGLGPSANEHSLTGARATVIGDPNILQKHILPVGGECSNFTDYSILNKYIHISSVWCSLLAQTRGYDSIR